MKKFVFYKKEKDLKIYNSNDLHPDNIQIIKDEGYSKLDFEIEANDKEDAIKKLKKMDEDNAKSALEFNKDLTISSWSSILESLIR